MGSSRLAERVLERLREEITRKGFTQTDVALQLDWSQSRVGKFLSGRMTLTLDALEGFCFVLKISPSEMVRDRGMEFCKELAPSDLRLLEILERDPVLRDAFLTIAQVRPPALPATPAATRPVVKSAKAKLR